MTDTQTVLEKLAAMEMDCLGPARGDCHGFGPKCHTPHCHEGCKGSGTVPRFPWARVECACSVDIRRTHDGWHKYKCPGWRVATLDEIRLRLEEVLISIGTNWELYPHNKTTPYICVNFIEDGTAEGKDIEGIGVTPTEAALDALLQAVEA